MKKKIPTQNDIRKRDTQHSDGCWWWLASLFMAAMLAVMAATAVSCTEEPVRQGVNEEEGLPATIRLNVVPDNATQAQTRASETKISDLHILVYNSKRELIGKSYSEKAPFTVNTRSGSGNTIYAIANTDSATLFDGTVAATEAKLKAMKTPALTAWDGLTTAETLPMVGEATKVTITAGKSTLTGNISLKRMVAKVTLNIGVATNSGITITGYRVFSLPKQSYFLPDTVDTATAWIDGTVTAVNAASANKTFFMYENRRGTVEGITDQKNKGESNAPDSATYVVIKGKANGYDAIWRVYLGANNTSDFNIKRNTPYIYTITLNRPSSVDTRIDEISNCYMVKPGAEVSIPVIRANESFINLTGSTYNSATQTYDQLQDATKWTAFLVWESSIGLVALSETTGKGPSGRFKVKGQTTAAEPNGGNAVVAIKNDQNDILWSWHIWVTTYDGSTTLTTNNGKQNFFFMDRSLGATTATSPLLTSCGLLYQWGRKDPFPSIGQKGGSWTIGTNADPILVYNASGNPITIQKISVPNVAPNNLTNAIRYPSTYYYNTNAPLDWFVYNSSSSQRNDLWSGSEKTALTAAPKSVFDPCPAGWRVPPYLNGISPLKGIESGLRWDGYGQIWIGTGWYIPASGYRNTNGTLSRVGTGGYTYIGSPNGTMGCNLGFDYAAVSSIASTERVMGLPIRCCKDPITP